MNVAEKMYREHYPIYSSDKNDLPKRAKMKAIGDALKASNKQNPRVFLQKYLEEWRNSAEWVEEMAKIGQGSMKGMDAFVLEEIHSQGLFEEDDYFLPSLLSERVVEDMLKYCRAGQSVLEEVMQEM